MTKSLVFILNCGSSSVKFRVIDLAKETFLLKGVAQKEGEKGLLSLEKEGKQSSLSLPSFDYTQVISQIIELVKEDQALYLKLLAVGHRVVHGGEYFQSAALIDALVIEKITQCDHLAPLHNPINLLGIQVAQKAFLSLPHVAVFDTAFHQTIPSYAYLYPLPYHFYSDYQVRRYGFHGMSHCFVVNEAAKKMGKPIEETAFISAHLGAGCSLAAVLGGKSVDTSMGLTPLEGLMMAKRSGDIDPSILPFLMSQLNCDVDEVMDLLNQESGFLGISGVSDDVRLIEKKAKAGHHRSLLAIQIFCFRLAKYIASYFVPLGRLDALIFTGGIGENSTLIREKTLSYLEPLGLKLDKARNVEHGKKSNGVISEKSSSSLVMRIQTDEELLIAREVRALLLKKEGA